MDRHLCDRVDSARYPQADSQNRTMIPSDQFLNGLIDLADDLPRRIGCPYLSVRLSLRALREVHYGRQEITGLEIHTDEAAGIGIRLQERRRAAGSPAGSLALQEDSILDEAVHVHA